jgi:hypothetical protein
VNTCSRRIEAPQRTSSRPISEPSNFVNEYYVNPIKKLLKRSFKLCFDSLTTCFLRAKILNQPF